MVAFLFKVLAVRSICETNNNIYKIYVYLRRGNMKWFVLLKNKT